MTPNSVLLDTSFFIRFLNDADPLFKNADGYFRYFLHKEIAMMISTISIAEYCVGGDVHELPLRNLQIVPFNLDHSKRTGEFARIAFNARRSGDLTVSDRILFRMTPNFLLRQTVRSRLSFIYRQILKAWKFITYSKKKLHQDFSLLI